MRMEYYLSIFFFFSSRRRHTRFDCDWSSDVCSSDLSAFRGLQANWPDCRGFILRARGGYYWGRSEEHTSELQSQSNLVCRLLLEKKKKNNSCAANTLNPLRTGSCRCLQSQRT